MAKKTNPHKNKSTVTKSTNTFSGKIEITPNGTGFFISDTFPIDIKVPNKHLNGALPNDIVEIKLIQKKKNDRSRMSGEVVRILKRGQKFYTGLLHQNKDLNFFISEEPKCYVDFFIPNLKIKNIKPNQRVVMEFKGWGDLSRNPQGTIVDVLEGTNEHDIAMKEILISKGFPLKFSEAVMNEAKGLSEELTQYDMDTRKDLRDTLTFTIDPIDAKDFDDAISFRKLEDNTYEVGIHIADVSHYILPGTELDNEAYARATSVYLPDRVLPMLPEQISNVLCSLRPNEDKRTFSVIVNIDENGEVKSKWIGRTITHSDRRFSYEEAQAIIENKLMDFQTEIHTLNTIAKKLRAQRFANGAINFSSEESGFVFDENKVPIDVKVKISQEAHQLIEEFMLLANRIVADKIYNSKTKNGTKIEGIYRIHDKPVEEKLNAFNNYVKTLGYELDTETPRTTATSFNKMLVEATGKPEKPLLEQLGIRTMAKAEYSTDNIGHYGLAFQDYTHFTSPIRRYPDILVHRILQNILTREDEHIKQLASKAQHCSQQERKAQEAEREGNKYFQVFFMEQRIGEIFDGVISGIASFGFWVETLDHKCEGLVSIKDNFPGEKFVYKEESYMLQNEAGLSFQMGQRVRIKVASANLSKRQLDYELITMQD